MKQIILLLRQGSYIETKTMTGDVLKEHVVEVFSKILKLFPFKFDRRGVPKDRI